MQKKWHIAICTSWFLFLYAIYAQKWAADTINTVFFIDASNLSITFKLLAFLFTPFGIVYHESVIAGMWNILIISTLLLSTITLLLLIIQTSFKTIAKTFIASILFVILFSFFVGIVTNLAFDQNRLIKAFALWADFDSYFPCTDNWARNTEKALFLNDGKILTYHPNNPDGFKFSVETCNYEKTF